MKGLVQHRARYLLNYPASHGRTALVVNVEEMTWLWLQLRWRDITGQSWFWPAHICWIHSLFSSFLSVFVRSKSPSLSLLVLFFTVDLRSHFELWDHNQTLLHYHWPPTALKQKSYGSGFTLTFNNVLDQMLHWMSMKLLFKYRYTVVQRAKVKATSLLFSTDVRPYVTFPSNQYFVCVTFASSS